MVKQLNLKAGTIDKMVTIPISQHCVTSHEGMKMFFAQMGDALSMFSVTDDGSTKLQPNTKQRKINLHVKGLSASNFRKLPFNLT